MRMNSGVRTDDVLRLLDDASLPESIRGPLTSGNELTRISLDSEGQWRHEGELFVNTNLMALFHRSIRRTPIFCKFRRFPTQLSFLTRRAMCAIFAGLNRPSVLKSSCSLAMVAKSFLTRTACPMSQNGVCIVRSWLPMKGTGQRVF